MEDYDDREDDEDEEDEEEEDGEEEEEDEDAEDGEEGEEQEEEDEESGKDCLGDCVFNSYLPNATLQICILSLFFVPVTASCHPISFSKLKCRRTSY